MDNINREAINLRNLSEQFKHARLNIQYGVSAITPNGNIGPLNHQNERGRSPYTIGYDECNANYEIVYDSDEELKSSPFDQKQG